MEFESMLSKKVVLLISSFAVLLTVGLGAYQVGLNQNKEDIQKLKAEKEQVIKQKAVSAEAAFEQDVRKMEVRIKSVNANLTQLVKRSEQINNDLASLEPINETIFTAMQAKIDALPRSSEQKTVPLPEGSSSAKVLAQPKFESGIPQLVLDNYQQETGINPAEIEELMKRTQ